MTAPSCSECDTEPVPGVHVDPLPARHTHVDEDGASDLCTFCLVQLILATDRYGSRVTVSVAPALAERVA